MFMPFLQTTLDAIHEMVIPYLDHKTPSVKAETAKFLARCFTFCSMTTLPKKLLKAFCAPLLKVSRSSWISSYLVGYAEYQRLSQALTIVDFFV